MKHFSLAFLAIGVISTAITYKLFQKHREADQVVLQTASIVERIEVMKRDTVYRDSFIYKTKYVYATRQKPDAYFRDTSVLSIPSLDRIGLTKFRDTVDNIALEDYIKPPKPFVFQDDNIYLAGTVLATGIQIDSLSVPAKLNISPIWGRNHRTTIEVSLLSGNPYITGLTPFKFSKRCLPLR
jgi:hypothetical protein